MLLSLERALWMVRGQKPTIHLWGSSSLANISNVTQREAGVEGGGNGGIHPALSAPAH